MSARPQSSSARPAPHEAITARIVAELEAGRVPWVQPWTVASAAPGLPFNAATGRRYSGINVLTLWHEAALRGLAGLGFLTFRQARVIGASVRRGERGIDVILARRVASRSEQARARAEGRDAVGTVPVLRHFTVFSTEQCDGLPDEIAMPGPRWSDSTHLEPRARHIIAASGAAIRIGGDSAYYSPSHDFIQLPRPEDFHEPINWHRTAFHELAHWTGHPTRLARDQTGRFGSGAYGREELVAELASAFVCAEIGLVPTVRHSDYIGEWLAIMHEDSRAVLRAASAASRAAEYLLGKVPPDSAS